MTLDLVALDLPELEEYVFETRRVLLEDLDEALQKELRTVIEDEYGDSPFAPFCTQEDLDKAIDEFNRNDIWAYNHGVLATAKAHARLCAGGYQAWVDYHGITQLEADRLSKDVQYALYRKYLRNYKNQYQQNPQPIDTDYDRVAKAIENVLRPYVHGKLDAATKAAMLSGIHRGLKGIFEEYTIEDISTGFTVTVNRAAGALKPIVMDIRIV